VYKIYIFNVILSRYVAGKKKHLCSLNPDKQWGGKRARTSAKRKWKSPGATKTVRIPETLCEAVLEFTRRLDAGEEPTDDEQERRTLQHRLFRAESKLKQIEMYLNFLEMKQPSSTANGQIAPVFPAENRSIFDQIPPQWLDGAGLPF
jgi:hypothetical protein